VLVTKVLGASWTVDVTYVCRCGTHYRATRWRWVDGEAMPDELLRCRERGPVRGRCPSCGVEAEVRTNWLELAPAEGSATVVFGPEQRHIVGELLSVHLGQVGARVESGALPSAAPWLLQPRWRFAGESRMADTQVLPIPVVRGVEPESTGIPVVVGGSRWPTEAPTSRAVDTYLGLLTMDQGAGQDGEIVTIDLELDDAGRSLWGQAALQVRPIHLYNHGYPLIGVRLVASYLGRMALIDGIVDVGSDAAAPIFSALSRRFRVQLVLQGEGATSVVRREVSARTLERNAALCLESAQASLARSEYPREAFGEALDDLRDTALDRRLVNAPHALVAGAYRHLISRRETWLALEHLEAASDKANLRHLMEVDGLAVDEYEGIRRRVLTASVEHGLCAPRRFWRRVIGSGVVGDFESYAERLGAALEANAADDDLDDDQRREAWARIAEMCELKQIPLPPRVARWVVGPAPQVVELDLGSDLDGTENSPPHRRRSVQPEDPTRPSSAAGEINSAGDWAGDRAGDRAGDWAGDRGGEAGSESEQAAARLARDLRDPRVRLRVATHCLNEPGPAGVEAVFAVIEGFEDEELLALLPTFAELGTQIVPALHGQLASPKLQVRQSAAILLGIAHDASSIVPLLELLTREETRAWFDVARAIGELGSSALERLCAVVRRSTRGKVFPIEHAEVIARVSRAMAEVVVVEGEIDPLARDAVEVLSKSPEPDIALAASRALATLHDVSVAGKQIRGERSLPEGTRLRGFSRRAHEAIMVPELDLLELDEELEPEII